MENKEKQQSRTHKAMTVVGIALCVIFGIMLICNITILVKGAVNPDRPPAVFGLTPLVVLTDSMNGDAEDHIEAGDLIFVHGIEAKDVKVGDVIAFFDPAGNGTSIVTHRVIEIVEDKGELKWRTRGDNNNTEDRTLVPFNNLVGIYQGKRLGGAGKVAMFLQTTTGLIVCVGIPLVLLVGYDILRRKKFDRAKQADTDALLAELEQLRAMKAAQSNTASQESQAEEE